VRAPRAAIHAMPSLYMPVPLRACLGCRLYHQMHEDFTDPAFPYGPAYCALKRDQLAVGRLVNGTGCPESAGCESEPRRQ
jgi:hypothetical protein